MLKSFICPDGKQCDIEQCLKPQGCRLGSRCTTWSFLSLAGEQRVWKGIPSVTQLLKGTCQAYLELVTDYAAEPDDSVYRVIGTKIHDKLAQKHPDKFIEERLTVWGISGQFDEYDMEDGVNILSDYKTSGSYAVAKSMGLNFRLVENGEQYQKKTTVKQPDGTEKTFQKGDLKQVKEYYPDPSKRDCWDYDMQLNMYRLMLESIGLPVDKMRLVFFVRDGGTQMAEMRGITRRTYLVDVPRFDDSEVRKYFEAKRDSLLSALESQKLPEKCSDRETWNGARCREYCPVREHCPYVKIIPEKKEAVENAQ